MGQARAHNFGLHYASGKPARALPRAGQGFWHRLAIAIVARLQSDSAPLGAAQVYSYAYRALPLPARQS